MNAENRITDKVFDLDMLTVEKSDQQQSPPPSADM
jgi:hypothetical protein